MDILSFILLCSLSINFDDKLIQSIIANESFNNPTYVRVEVAKFGVGYDNKIDPVQAINEIIKSGKESYIGLMGIPLSDAINNGYTSEDLLDECINIQLGTAYIDMFIDNCKAEGKSDIHSCSIKKYAHYTGQNRIEFTNKVIHNAIQIVSKNKEKNRYNSLNNHSVHLDINDNNETNETVFVDYKLNIKSQEKDEK